MPNQPLQHSAPPQGFSQFVPGSFSAGIALEWFLYLVFAFWAVYTLVAIYHWLKYSHASWVTFPAIALHLIVSLSLISYALSGSSLWLTPYVPLP